MKNLFHFHKVGVCDQYWHSNTNILVTDNFKNDMYRRYQQFTAAVELDNNQKINFHDLISLLIQTGSISNSEEFLQLLNDAWRISFMASEFKRETALENYRLKYCSELPSRLHSIYVTDEQGVEAWSKKFGSAKLELYKVEVDGIIFKTSEELIPLETKTYQEIYNDAKKYWSPNLKNISEDSNEYLVKGKVKVLEKISF